ncbi:MAG TPA: hypothetical protein VN830_06055 [Verrucomicrobiae bacterium]|nr:hypothetical protein [Verrucomicrobiae bacterium]
MKNCLIVVTLVISCLAFPVTAKNKKNVRLFLMPHPRETQNGGSCAVKDKHTCPEVAFLRDADTQVVETRGDIFVAGEIFKFPSGHLAATVSVANLRSTPVQVVPEKVFFIDDLGQPHLSIPDYVAKANIAQEYHLTFNPPPPRTYYSVSEVPVASQTAGPMFVYAIQDIGTGYLLYGTQPQITTYERAVTEHTDYSNVLGYEIGYLIAGLVNKHDVKSKIDWIDKIWLHRSTVGSMDFQFGTLTFLSTQDLLTSRSLNKPVKLVIFIEDQQFVFEYGPEVTEKELK